MEISVSKHKNLQENANICKTSLKSESVFDQYISVQTVLGENDCMKIAQEQKITQKCGLICILKISHKKTLKTFENRLNGL